MSVSHGDLFSEIGQLVLAANAGEAIDLRAKAEELAKRYKTLGLSEAMLARAIARSIGAIGFSMAMVSNGDHRASGEGQPATDGAAATEGEAATAPKEGAFALFPSGVRLAVLS